tara:strand:- start:276 stop:1205 length:930 start_codon:yes stop_codon:yes gene_type:complete
MDLTKYIKRNIKTKFNGEIVEFYADSADEVSVDYEIYDDLMRCNESMDQDVHDSIWGARNPVNVIQIDAKTYWRVMLMSRHLKHTTGTFYSVSKCIEILSTGHKFFNPPKENQIDYPLDFEEDRYRKLSRLLKGLTVVIYLNTEGMFIFNEKESFERSLHELFIPDITWEPVPLFRFILLGHLYPELLTEDEWKHISCFVNDSDTNKQWSGEDLGQFNNFIESDLCLDSIVDEAKRKYIGILEENKRIKDSGKKLNANQRSREHYFKVLSKVSDDMKDSFRKKYELFIKVTGRVGRYREVDRLFSNSSL